MQRSMTVIAFHENAGLRRDAICSQVIDALEAVSEWKFRREAADHRVKATIDFKTNCPSKGR